MWKQLYDLARQLLLLLEDLQKIKEEQKEMRQELRELARVVKDLQFELRQGLSHEAHEREKLVLQLQNTLLHFERRLPPGPADDKRRSD